MPLPVSVSAAPVGIQHQIASGSKFTGELPTTTPVFANSSNKYPVDTVGGLFKFENYKPTLVIHYVFDFGASVPYELAVVSLDSTGAEIVSERIVFEQGTARSVAGPPHYGFLLGANQALRVTNPGLSAPSAAMRGVVFAADATAILAG